MPFVEQDDVGTFVQDAIIPKERAAPGLGETAGAAFRLENDAYNAYELLTRSRSFKPTAGYNAITKLKDFDAENRTNLYENYRDNFIGVRSDEEFQDILGRINKEQADRETLEAAGASGVALAIGAGVLSPTMLMPFIGQARGVKAVAQAAALGGAAGALQELPLQLAQETRTGAESAFAIGASTVMGGLLGGAVQVLRKGELDTLSAGLERDADMVRSNFAPPISTSGAALGAAGALDEYAGKLKGAYVSKVVDWLGPVTRVINQEDNRTMSWAMSQLSDAGLQMEKNALGVATSVGGTVESRIKTYLGSFAEVTEGLDGNYAKYIFGEGNVPGLAPNIRAAIGGAMDAKKLSKMEFKEEISRALREGDVHAIPEVAAVAKQIREKIFDPILREAQRVGIYKDVDVLGDTSYLHRVYNHEKIGANTNEFVEVLAKHYSEKLNAQYGEELTKLDARSAREQQLIEDLTRPKEEVDAIRETLRQELKALDEGRNQTLIDAEDQIATLRSNARLAKQQGDDEARKAFLADARQIERSMGDDLKSLRAERSAKRSRMQGLARAAVALEERQMKKLAQIEKIEDINERQMMQVARAGQRILNKVDTVSDKELDGLLNDLQNDFFDLATQLEKGEAKLAGLLEKEDIATQSIFKGEAEVQFVGANTEDAIASVRAAMVKNIDPDTLRRLDNGYSKSDPELSTDEVRNAAVVPFDKPMVLYREPGFQSKKLIDDTEFVSTSGKQSDGLSMDGSPLGPRAELQVMPGVRGFVADSGYRGGEVIIAPGAKYKKVSSYMDGDREVIVYRVTPGKVEGQEVRNATTTSRMSDIARDMEALDTIDRRSVRASIMEALEEVNQRALNQIEKRLARENKLIEAAAKLDPAEVTRRIDNIKGLSRERRAEFIAKLQGRADNIDLNARTADFSAHARTLAEQVKDKIMATNVRMPLNDVMAAERGAELARVLDIPSAKVEKFLENDVERVLRSYLRTLPADIEIKRKFGDVNGQEIFQKATEELNNKIAQLGERAAAEKWDEKKLQSATKKLNDEFKDRHRDLEVVIGRLRGTHGLPDNPDGMAYRMARTVMNLNVLRLMGGTLISSIPDAARPIMRYGLTRTFRDGFVPLVTNFKRMEVSAREAKLAGAALDAILHTRSQSIHDVMDDFGRHSKFERGVEYATNKMGAVALFDYWTTAMKQFSSSVIITKLTDSLDIVAGGAKASAKEVAQAQEFLASKGLTGETAEMVWKELNTGKGGERVNGVLMPNTESWTSEDAKRAFRSAIVSEVDNTIITPGVERPTWMTSSTLGRVLGQFKSFGMSSTFKVLASGLQQRDMAFFNGTMVSLALGALSYYLSSVIAGGDAYKKMQSAGLGKWADEALNRSGVLGVLSEGQRFFERIPATQKYVSFSGDRTTRRGGDDLIDVVLGPSLGFGQAGAKVLSGLDDPTKSTLHNFRTMLPFQNLLYVRQGLDQIEAATNLPERRN